MPKIVTGAHFHMKCCIYCRYLFSMITVCGFFICINQRWCIWWYGAELHSFLKPRVPKINNSVHTWWNVLHALLGHNLLRKKWQIHPNNIRFSWMTAVKGELSETFGTDTVLRIISKCDCLPYLMTSFCQAEFLLTCKVEKTYELLSWDNRLANTWLLSNL